MSANKSNTSLGKDRSRAGRGKGHGKFHTLEELDETSVYTETEQAEGETGPSRVKRWIEPDSDTEDDPSNHYNVEESWKTLFNLPSCQCLMIKEPQQRRMDLVVGQNVTQEFPWKQIKYKILLENLDEIEGGDILTSALTGFDPENHILIGYAPLLTQNQDDVPEGDPFIVYINPDEARLALAIIRNIEAYERWVISRRLVKKPRRWVSLGSENEVNITLETRITEPLEVEIQSVYPLTIPANKGFSFRKCQDVRDGYVELLPPDTVKFENIMRKRVTVAIQSAPEKKNLEQQTDPTFPTNAWAQYLYEINEDEGLDESSEDEEAVKEQLLKASRTPTPESAEPPPPKPPPVLSENIQRLLEKLEFNQIDMYRNDYAYISDQAIEHYTTPYLEETLCFANITKSYQRYVCGIDWYPSLSGLIVTSYTFTTPATIDSVTHRVDVVQRAVLQPNPILMWSFADNLNYKLEFESPQEVTILSFCPHDSNLLFGGAKNGQIIAWDLQDRAEKLDTEEVLTAAQAKYRSLIGDFFKWTIQTNEDSIVPVVTASGLEVSQKAAITGIYWLSKHIYANSFGKVYNDPDKRNRHKFFATCAIDGTITFWDLNALGDKKQASASRRDQPKALTQSESIYKGRVLRPVFTVAFSEPITAIVADTSVFGCAVMEPLKKRKNLMNFRIALVPKDPSEMRQSVITSSFYGRIERLNWLGLYADANGREHVQSALSFARVHDGPVIAMKKNPFFPKVFVSIGRTVFAVWKEDYNYSPIFWRKCANDLTAVAWSEARPGVLFLTRIDGNMEAWDILSRDDDACYNDILGGGIVTAISEHRPNDPEKLLGIGDYNSSFRMVKLPPSFYMPEPNELERVKDYYHKEENRKKSIQAWEHKYYENNRDIIEAKREAEIEARKEMERIEKENMLNTARKIKEEASEKEEEAKRLPYTERMKRHWDQLNLNRLLAILMSRKRVNAEQLERETQLEKELLAYEAAKKESLARILQRVGEEVAAVRSRILPAEKVDLQRIDMILSSVREVMETVDTYDDIEEGANETVQNFDMFDTLNYIDFLHRGVHRRMLLNKAVGGNTERLYWYECAKDEDELDECNWGYDRFVLDYVDMWERDAEARERASNATVSSASAEPSDLHLDVSTIGLQFQMDYGDEEVLDEGVQSPGVHISVSKGELKEGESQLREGEIPSASTEMPPDDGDALTADTEVQPTENEMPPTEDETQLDDDELLEDDGVAAAPDIEADAQADAEPEPVDAEPPVDA